jgi:hypothetical protein
MATFISEGCGWRIRLKPKILPVLKCLLQLEFAPQIGHFASGERSPTAVLRKDRRATDETGRHDQQKRFHPRIMAAPGYPPCGAFMCFSFRFSLIILLSWYMSS